MRGTLDTIGDNENLTQDSIAISNYDNSISVSNRVYKQGLKILSTVLFSSNKNSNCTPNHCKKNWLCVVLSGCLLLFVRLHCYIVSV